MKVNELIEKLKEVDQGQNCTVHLDATNPGGRCSLPKSVMGYGPHSNDLIISEQKVPESFKNIKNKTRWAE